jgi:hypothetical protein
VLANLLVDLAYAWIDPRVRARIVSQITPEPTISAEPAA